jgi:glycosyltransferase involved in cell wall biosynthesis
MEVVNRMFSIVCATYNRAYILDKAIKSVQNQLIKEWELIIIDDGSTDNTAETVHCFSNEDSRIKYHYQQNSERSAARNKGIQLAQGDYICFLDSDDQLEENHLSGLKSFIETNADKNQSILAVFSKIVDENGFQIGFSTIETGENDLETVVLNTITPGQICVPRSLLKENNFNEKIKISEDTELLYRLVMNNRLVVVDQYSLVYVKHYDNSVNPLKYNAYKERQATLKLIFSYPKSKLIRREIKRKLLSDCFFGISKFYASKKHLNLVRWNMLKAIILFPETRIKEKMYLFLFPKKAI